MKYGSLKTEKIKVLNIPVNNRGVNLSDLPQKLKDGQLSQGVNVWYSDGKLKTRPGINSTTADIINSPIEGSAGRHNFYFTDTEIFYNGKKRRIVTEKFYYDLSNLFICVYFLGEDGSVQSGGYLQFGRLNDENFYTPQNITFYAGKPQNGGGIFALVSLVNEYDYIGEEYRIYEINSQMNGWDIVTGYYIPTVYINGRGNAYEQASQASNAYFVGNPTELEAPNLLNGSFYAYYTSDGYSYSFRLPYSNISDSSVVCRVYQSMESYTEWVIYAGQTTATAEVSGVTVKANLDRSKGLIYFTVSAGTYSVPKAETFFENNIRITAKKDIGEGLKNVVSSTCCATLGSRIVFSGGKAKNRFYYSRYDNPLYFPYNPDDSIGFSDSEVTGLLAVDNKIIAFKSSEIYSLTLKKGDYINDTALLTDYDGIFYKKDKFDVKCVDKNIGCNNKLTASNIFDRSIWLGSDGNVYAMTSAGEVFELSSAVRPYLEKISVSEREAAVGTALGKYYILSFGTKVIIIECSLSGLKGNTDDISIYIWEFPKKCFIKGAFGKYGEMTFLCENEDENVFYTASLSGENDQLIIGGNPVEHSINSSIKTKRFILGNLKEKQRIKNVCMQLFSGGKVDINICAGKNIFSEFTFQSADFSDDMDNLVKLICELGNAKWFELSLSSEHTLNLGEIDLYYT